MRGGYGMEHLAFGLVVATVCLVSLTRVLPHILPALIVLGGLAVVLRLVFFHTRKW